MLSLIILITATYFLYAQDQEYLPAHADKAKHQPAGFDVLAGYNYINVNRAASINASSKSGYTVGIVHSPGALKSKLSYRTELLYSRQGYNYTTNTNTGKVNLDYIIMPHLSAINITKYFQLQIGGQVAFLLNGSVDSTSKSNAAGSLNAVTNRINSFYNKVLDGFAGGLELHPYKSLLFGGKININFNNTNKTLSVPTLEHSSFIMLLKILKAMRYRCTQEIVFNFQTILLTLLASLYR